MSRTIRLRGRQAGKVTEIITRLTHRNAQLVSEINLLRKMIDHDPYLQRAEAVRQRLAHEFFLDDNVTHVSVEIKADGGYKIVIHVPAVPYRYALMAAGSWLDTIDGFSVVIGD